MGALNITLSVVSHRQNALVNRLLEDVRRVSCRWQPGPSPIFQ